MSSTREFLYGLAIHPISNGFIRNLQLSCGVKGGGDRTHEKTLWYIFFRFASMLGEEIYSLIPLIYWVALFIGPSYALNFVTLCLGGQLLKDVYKLPRPPADDKSKIVRLEKHHETEYGMPSTHTLGGLLPFTVLLALNRHGMQLSWIWWMFAVVYLLCVSLSRLYLGVHSLLDVVSSVLLGGPVVVVLHIAGEELERIFFFHPYSIIIHIAMIAVFILAVPKADPWTASYGTSTQIFGLFIGIAMSLWYTRNHAMILWQCLEESSYQNWSEHTQGRMLKRIFLGFVIVIAVKALFKVVLMATLKHLYKSGLLVEEEKFMTDTNGDPVPLDKLYVIECTTRLISYTAIGVAVVIFTPLVWSLVSL